LELWTRDSFFFFFFLDCDLSVISETSCVRQELVILRSDRYVAAREIFRLLLQTNLHFNSIRRRSYVARNSSIIIARERGGRGEREREREREGEKEREREREIAHRCYDLEL